MSRNRVQGRPTGVPHDPKPRRRQVVGPGPLVDLQLGAGEPSSNVEADRLGERATEGHAGDRFNSDTSGGRGHGPCAQILKRSAVLNLMEGVGDGSLLAGLGDQVAAGRRSWPVPEPVS
jgi:hypothetical protein